MTKRRLYTDEELVIVRRQNSQKAGLDVVKFRLGIFAPKNRGCGGRVGGKIIGRRKVESGFMDAMQYGARHRRWHVLGSYHWRGVWISPNPKSWCDACIDEGLIVAFG